MINFYHSSTFSFEFSSILCHQFCIRAISSAGCWHELKIELTVGLLKLTTERKMWLRSIKPFYLLNSFKKSSKPPWILSSLLSYTDSPYSKAKASPLQVCHSTVIIFCYTLLLPCTWTTLYIIFSLLLLAILVMGCFGLYAGNQNERQI